ncbi:hypothetical protein M758_12G034900 [Ceratodon purpureus]|nr:hypothetical protein M758_12G034900 [Ceratodon purpureus]
MSSGRLRVENIVGFVCGEVLGLHLGFLLFRCHHAFVCSCVCARKNTHVPRRIVVLHRLRPASSSSRESVAVERDAPTLAWCYLGWWVHVSRVLFRPTSFFLSGRASWRVGWCS